MHVGFGHGLWGFNDALTEANWDPPRYTTTAFEMAHINAEWMRHLAGWIGLDSYDERNEVGQAFLDRFEARYGRRPGYFMPCLCHDVATVIVRGLAGARPLTGAGVKDAMEDSQADPAAPAVRPARACDSAAISGRAGWVSTISWPDGCCPTRSAHVFHAAPSDHISQAVALASR